MSVDNVLIWNDDTGCWCSPARGNCRGVSELHLMGQFPLGQSGAARWLTTLRDLMLAGFCLLFVVGCNSTVSPEIAERASELSSAKSMQSAMESHATALATALAAQKLTGEMTLENTQTIIAKLNTLEASLSTPKTNGQEVIKSAPEPPAKANTAAIPSQVATPGASSETLTELATRLYAQGVNVHMKTREELEAIDAQIVGTKSTHVQYQSRPTYSQPSGTVCINGQCFVPQVSSRRRR